MQKILVVIDVQNDFVYGSLGTPEAREIIPNIVKKIEDWDERGAIILTQDYHTLDYLETNEGKHLPIPHCQMGAEGIKIVKEIDNAMYNKLMEHKCTLSKSSFGCSTLVNQIAFYTKDRAPFVIEIVGLCTDICVITNALVLKTYFPETQITVDSSCCAGTTKEMHEAALAIMESCQIDII